MKPHERIILSIVSEQLQSNINGNCWDIMGTRIFEHNEKSIRNLPFVSI